jgi:group II intron reverse transcriptase/maturase
MQKAEYVFEAMHKLGMANKPITRIYRQMYNEEMYLGAYAKLYPNRGALSRGVTNETVDGMSLERIERIIEEMKYERFNWNPVNRTYIPKRKGGQRPIGKPDFRDKLVQEIIRAILSAYYEPQFSQNSHGFRPERGCHTALAQIAIQCTGASWFIEGDIKGCFDNIDHDILMSILRRDIQDNRFLNLIESGLKAGILNDWKYEQSYSGVPQGGVLSPLLANIYLNEFDQFVEQTLIPKWSKGQQRHRNPQYRAIEYRLSQARKQGDREAYKRLKTLQRSIPSKDTHDPNYRRLFYIRYADDYLLSYIGPKHEAEAIKEEIAEFLQTRLKLQQNQEKTLITHAKTEQAHFLGYAISVYHADHKLSLHQNRKRRCANGRVRLGIPAGLIQEKIRRYMRHNKVVSERALLDESVAEIIKQYQARFRGLAEYYKFAVDRHRLGGLRGVMQEAMVKTIAHKKKMTVRQVYQKYKDEKIINGRTYKILAETVETERGVYRFEWGGIPLTTVKPGEAKIDDTLPKVTWSRGGELIQRLQANRCEICGSRDRIAVHHIRKLKDLKKRWRGRREKPEWVKHMIARQRKTLVVCNTCHHEIHNGKMDKPINVPSVNWRAV